MLKLYLQTQRATLVPKNSQDCEHSIYVSFATDISFLLGE